MISLGRNRLLAINALRALQCLLVTLQNPLHSWIEGTAEDAATGQYDRQSPTSCRDENHSDAHDVYETRHRHLLNAPAPNPHTCHKQNPPRRHRLSWWHTAVVPIPFTRGKRGHRNFQDCSSCHTNHTTTERNTRPIDCCVADSLLDWQGITHRHGSAIVCLHPSPAPPLLRLHLRL